MTRPILPLPIRLMNRVGGAIEKIGIQLSSLDEANLLAAARKKTGLDDFGDASFKPALRALLESLENEAQLSALGRVIARTDLLQHLQNRLGLEDWHRRHPEIGQAEVKRPIFIIGQGRTGTTILHELLELDPTNRVPLTWEVDTPFPPPERESYASDPRIAQSQQQLDRADSIIPEFKKMHRMGARLPQECVRLTGIDFTTFIFPAQWRVPSYTEWLMHEAPMAPVYANHRRMLQLLQWRCPADRWVCKSPGHLWSLDALMAEYPDALLIQPHRCPLKIVSSLSSLEWMLRSMSSETADIQEIAREWSHYNAIAYERSVDFRERGGIDPERVIDVHFASFIQDPIAVVRSIYEKFELPFSDDFEARMRKYIADNPSDRDGKHEHDFAQTGLDEAEERKKVERYQDYFGVASEPT
jgi:hypothetical protein